MTCYIPQWVGMHAGCVVGPILNLRIDGAWVAPGLCYPETMQSGDLIWVRWASLRVLQSTGAHYAGHQATSLFLASLNPTAGAGRYRIEAINPAELLSSATTDTGVIHLTTVDPKAVNDVTRRIVAVQEELAIAQLQVLRNTNYAAWYAQQECVA